MNRSQPLRSRVGSPLLLQSQQIPIQECYSTFQRLIGG